MCVYWLIQIFTSRGEAGTLLLNKPKNICGKDVPLLFLGDSAYPLLSPLDDETLFRLWNTYSMAEKVLLQIE